MNASGEGENSTGQARGIRNLARIILVVVFISLLAVPLVMRRIAARREINSLLPGIVSFRYGFHFEEVAKASGINFTHQAPTLDHRLDHIMPQVASMGAAVSVADFNRDGFADLYVTNSGEGSKNALYKNNQDGTFTDVAAELGIADLNQVGTGVSMGSVWATTTTTVTKISSFTSGASPSSFTTTRDYGLRA